MAASYAPPIIHLEFGLASANLFTSATISATDCRPFTFGPCDSRPADKGCACPSAKAGITKAPAKSIVSSTLPESASEPSALTRPSSIKSALLSWPKLLQTEPLINRVLTGVRICEQKTPTLFLSHEFQGIFERSSDSIIFDSTLNAFTSGNHCWHKMH